MKRSFKQAGLGAFFSQKDSDQSDSKRKKLDAEAPATPE